MIYTTSVGLNTGILKAQCNFLCTFRMYVRTVNPGDDVTERIKRCLLLQGLFSLARRWPGVGYIYSSTSRESLDTASEFAIRKGFPLFKSTALK